MAVAAETGISLRYLHSLFRSEPWSALQYLKLQRLAHARQLFTLSDARSTSVTDVATACGYSNLSQFSTAFRREFGLSPKEALHHRAALLQNRDSHDQVIQREADCSVYMAAHV